MIIDPTLIYKSEDSTISFDRFLMFIKDFGYLFTTKMSNFYLIHNFRTSNGRSQLELE